MHGMSSRNAKLERSWTVRQSCRAKGRRSCESVFLGDDERLKRLSRSFALPLNAYRAVQSISRCSQSNLQNHDRTSVSSNTNLHNVVRFFLSQMINELIEIAQLGIVE